MLLCGCECRMQEMKGNLALLGCKLRRRLHKPCGIAWCVLEPYQVYNQQSRPFIHGKTVFCCCITVLAHVASYAGSVHSTLPLSMPCLQSAKKRLEFRDSKRPSTAPYAAQQQQQQQQAADAASESAASGMSCATAAGRELYERGMEMKHRQEQIREQLRKASDFRCTTSKHCF